MHPRLYIQSFQYVIFNAHTHELVFETRHVTGDYYHFTLDLEQVFALDDAIALITRTPHYGDYPLGQRVWLRYTAKGACLYETGYNRNFYFENFHEYKGCAHKRVMSLIHSYTKRAVNHHATHKRPLSNHMRQSHQSRAYERCRRRAWKTTPRATDHADVSDKKQMCSVLSEWNDTSSRRRSDSLSTSSSVAADLSPPSPVRLHSTLSVTSMESE